MFNGDGCQVRVRRQITGSSERQQQFVQQCQMPGARLNDDRGRLIEPELHYIEGRIRGKWISK